jgi:prevent-host-death family protein
MAEAIPLRELAHHTGRYVERVQAGERVPITKNGKLVAVLTSPTDEDRAIERLAEKGLIDPQHMGAPGWINSFVPAPARSDNRVSPLETLLQMRDEEQR